MHVGSDISAKVLVCGFLIVNACCMGFGLLCTTSSSFCLMFGSEKALRGGGQDLANAFSAMDTAIKILKEKST